MSFADVDLGQGLVLRAWRESDAPRLAQIANDVRVWRHMSDLFPHPYTLEIAQHWVTRGHIDFGGDNCAVLELGVLIGAAGHHQDRGPQRCNSEIGYWLAPTAWGRGIATRVAAALTLKAFEPAEVTRVFAGIHAGNPASMRVLAKCGFEREGVLRLSTIKAGQAIDRVLYARYREARPTQPLAG